MSKLLVVSAIKESLGSDEDLVFLGEWCKEHGSDFLWNNRKNKTLEFYLKDRNKFEKDYEYLGEFFERLLSSLSSSLNSYNKVNYSIRCWRIILGPWLLTYVSALWSRWECLKIAFENNKFDKTIVLCNPELCEVASSHEHAIHLSLIHI